MRCLIAPNRAFVIANFRSSNYEHTYVHTDVKRELSLAANFLPRHRRRIFSSLSRSESFDYEGSGGDRRVDPNRYAFTHRSSF